jgi:hypothetical protein
MSADHFNLAKRLTTLANELDTARKDMPGLLGATAHLRVLQMRAFAQELAGDRAGELRNLQEPAK